MKQYCPIITFQNSLYCYVNTSRKVRNDCEIFQVPWYLVKFIICQLMCLDIVAHFLVTLFTKFQNTSEFCGNIDWQIWKIYHQKLNLSNYQDFVGIKWRESEHLVCVIKFHVNFTASKFGIYICICMAT